MRRLAACLAAAILTAVTPASGQETTIFRLYPSQKESRARQTKEDMREMIDSLNLIIESLRSEVTRRDSIEEAMAKCLEEATVTVPECEEYTAEKTDSLLNMYYVQNQFVQDVQRWADFDNLEEIGEFNSDSVRFTTNVADSILIERLKKLNSYITLPFNETVRNYMILYSEKNQAKMKRILSLSDYYLPMFEEILNKYDMPLELKYMSIIESALNPVAKSRMGARGIWQFMYKTGRQYGLEINSFVDERLDVEKAADAAARYMKDAYDIFGDWALAISSYNCGPGNVNKAIRRSGGRRDFWSIYPYLPRETRGYMPAFVGAMYAMNYYKEYGIEPNPSPMPAHADTFVINRNLHFRQICDMIGIDIEQLREMNPQYFNDIIPGDQKPYTLKLPYNFTNAFIDCQDTVYTHLADSLLNPAILKNIEAGNIRPVGGGGAIHYKVKNGDYLGRIASRYHVSVKQLMKWNNLRNNNIRVGQVLTIYTNAPVAATTAKTTAPASSSTAPASGQQAQSNPDAAPQGEDYTIYTVKSGDTLFKICQKYHGVTVAELMSLNNCKSNIHPGQKLKIPNK